MTSSLASRLRDVVDIVRPTRTALGKGNFAEVPAPVATGVAAEVLALTGSEGVQEKILRGVRVYRVVIRWRPGVLQTDQLILAGEAKPLNIRSAVDPDRRRRELVIHADTDA